jgi:hypothetical protein
MMIRLLCTEDGYLDICDKNDQRCTLRDSEVLRRTQRGLTSAKTTIAR